MPSRTSIAAGIFLALAALLVPPIYQKIIVFGVFREIKNIHGEDVKLIPGTVMCEDLHLEETTQHLFAACSDNPNSPPKWYPPLGVLTDPEATAGGAIVRIDPKSFTSTKLKIHGLGHAFVPHGIDILNDPHDKSVLWIYAMNHLPNPERYRVDPPVSKVPERSPIEIFRHVLHSDTVEWARSVRHPLIQMPNDLYAVSPTEFYVTNDHTYHEGLGRLWEDLGTQVTSPGSYVLHVEMLDLDGEDPTSSIRTTVALQGLHNPNGLGHGDPGHPEEVMINDASGGVLVRAKRDPETKKLTILERIQMDSSLDNPHFYLDRWATPGKNASGYLLPGMAHAVAAMEDFKFNDRAIPSICWHVRTKEGGAIKFEGKNNWERRMVWQDDGKVLRTASGSVMIGIDPKKTGGKKKGWLFLTGMGSMSVVAIKVGLD